MKNCRDTGGAGAGRGGTTRFHHSLYLQPPLHPAGDQGEGSTIFMGVNLGVSEVYRAKCWCSGFFLGAINLHILEGFLTESPYFGSFGAVLMFGRFFWLNLCVFGVFTDTRCLVTS